MRDRGSTVGKSWESGRPSLSDNKHGLAKDALLCNLDSKRLTAVEIASSATAGQAG